jgi:hypothetical protein
MRRWFAIVAMVSVAAAAFSAATPTEPRHTTPSPRATTGRGKLPLAFEPNVGPADRSVLFVSHLGRGALTLSSTGAGLSLPDRSAGSVALGQAQGLPSSTASFGMSFMGADPSATVVGADRLPGTSNYFIGNDPREWRTGVPNYARVVYRDLYAGIDLTFYGNQSGHLEYDFTVRAGADPSRIGLEMIGASSLRLAPSGDLVMGMGGSALTQLRPRIYQMANGDRVPLAGGYVLDGNRIRFHVSSFDHSLPLVIDPEVVYSTYLGGSTGGDLGEGEPAVDSSGHVFVCGDTTSIDFPITHGAYQGHFAGQGDYGFGDAFITELSAQGTGLVYSTYFGGTGDDDASSCVLDAEGNVYLDGLTTSLDLPTTPGAFQTSVAACTLPDCLHGFLAKLNSKGSRLVYSTYIAGNQSEYLQGIRVDSHGDAFALGATCSTDFPTTPGAYQTSDAGGPPGICPTTAADYVVLELNSAGSGLVYSTYLGGPGDDCCEGGIAIDGSNDAYVVFPTSDQHFPTTRGAFQRHFGGGPDDVVVAKIDPSGSRLLYSTYLGGSGDEPGDGSIAVDAAGNAYTAAGTSSKDFPVTRGAFQSTYAGGDGDGFVTKLNAQGSALVWSSYVGGSGDDGLGPVMIDGLGHVLAGLGTASTDFPMTEGAFQKTNHGAYDAGFVELSGDGSRLLFSTYWGGSADEVVNGAVLDRDGSVYATGCTSSTDFPTTPGAFQRSLQGGTPLGSSVCTSLPADAWVTKIDFGQR